MKKLMIAAAAAAMIGGAFADGGVAQVYDFTATVKTSACSGKSAKDVCGDTVYYRSQITQKLYGKFWGCGCKVIACPENYGKPYEADQGYMFWLNTKVGGAFHDADFAWSILQRLGKKGENVEGAFDLTLTDCEGETVAVLAGAGYGTAKIYCDEGVSTDESYIKSMSGNIVGKWDASSDVIATGCAYCGNVENCTVFAFCDCLAENNDEAAVFGSFTIKYNASQTKAVNSGKYIDEVAFKKNAAVLDEFDCIAADDDDDGEEEEPSAKEAAIAAYKEAKAAYETAEKAYDDAQAAVKDITDGKQTKALEDAMKDAVAAEAKAKSTYDDAVKATAEITAVDTANGEVTAAETALEKANKDLDEAKTQAQVAAAKTAIEKAEENLANAKKGLENARKAVPAADAEKLADYDTAYAAELAAKDKVTEATEALDLWNSDKTASEKAKEGTYGAALYAAQQVEEAADEAKDAANMQKVITQANCKSAGGAADCE